ncbi:hypothetical protein AYI68_g3501 [Smittium mucronatum]|uniref:Carbohydrate-binding module family 19 domain-containing protein n=1 Tax=Smittium mucronatum TaxID=133383 RepID=A0A1R0GZQ1_9FUNG|nr:hypothetical protein AYI68_g3501 [Smittium mucronatum]
MLFSLSQSSFDGLSGFLVKSLVASVVFQGLVSVGATQPVEALEKKQDRFYGNGSVAPVPVFNHHVNNGNFVNSERHHTKTVTAKYTRTKYIEKTRTKYINRCTDTPKYYKKRDYAVIPINGNVYNSSPNNIIYNNNREAGNRWKGEERHEGGYNRENVNYGEHRRVGGWCREGSYACVGVDNPTFLQCLHGKFIQMPCGPGTVCVRNGRDSIYCGYPSYFRKH